MNFRISIFCLMISLTSNFIVAQELPVDSINQYHFQKVRINPSTSLKNQSNSGTCWSFAGISFIESEMMRIGKDSVDLSEMFVVRNCYAEKAEKYVRLHGKMNFSSGGLYHDVIYVLKNYGIMPEEAYNGIKYGEVVHDHSELEPILEKYLEPLVVEDKSSLTTSWFKGFNGILDAYFGEIPKEFSYQNKKYTPQSYAKEVVGIHPDDYIELTSFTHHPFYEKFTLEIPDNWMWKEMYNIPLSELQETMRYAIENGYTIAWGTDISENYYRYDKGLAIVPSQNTNEMSSDQKKLYKSLSTSEKNSFSFAFKQPFKEQTITQEIRQEAFDHYYTTDDHGMHIVGCAKDQNGTLYYIAKNSWESDNTAKGYIYASENYVLFKTTSILINKNAIPQSIRNKLKIF